MKMIDAIADKFVLEIDGMLKDNKDYMQINNEFHRYIEKELSEEQATRIDEFTGRLTAAVGNSAAAAGIKIGAKITVALLEE